MTLRRGTTKNKIVMKDLTALTILIKTSFYWLYVGLGRQIYLSNSQARAGGTVQHEQGEFWKLINQMHEAFQKEAWCLSLGPHMKVERYIDLAATMKNEAFL